MVVAALYYSVGSIKAVKARLKTLVDNDYVQAGIPTKHFCSPYYYMLGAEGIRYLEDTGYISTNHFGLIER